MLLQIEIGKSCSDCFSLYTRVFCQMPQCHYNFRFLLSVVKSTTEVLSQLTILCTIFYAGDCLPDMWWQRFSRSYSYLCQVSWCRGTPVMPLCHYIIYIQLFLLCVLDVMFLDVSLCYGGLKLERNIFRGKSRKCG